MAVGRRSRGAMRIAAGMAGFIQEARIIHPARLPIERGIGGARDRHRRVDAVRGVDARQHDPVQDAAAGGRRRNAELFDRLRETPQRECLAGPGRPQYRRQKRRLNLRGHAKLGQRLDDLAGVQKVRAVGGIAKEDRLRRDGRGRRGRRDRDGRRGRLRGGPWRERQGWLLGRPDLAKQADLRVHAWLGQSILHGRAREFAPKARLI